ncbi:hypothetical protein [Scandinavium sp.]|uniref:hypothetical protein n=1 Tax=Scandinavium sp. TaxID=2830653 RepID=UPI00289DA8AC|nr:hypothetical protein [Scandinavium sp.]
MTPEIRRRIHAFRNALVLAADTRSHECFEMARWQELNVFPHGCCDLASNFLAQYLRDSNPDLKPVIIRMQTTEEFRHEYRSAIQSHVIVELTGWFIDLTLNQFADYEERVVIERNNGTLGSLIRGIKKHAGTVNNTDIQLDANDLNGSMLYSWLRETADHLLASSPAGDH